MARIIRRGVSIRPMEWQKLYKGVRILAVMGIDNSLLLM